MIDIQVRTSEFMAEVGADVARPRTGVKREVNRQGMRLLKAVREHASGRPGPEVVTGDYLRSIQGRLFFDGDEWVFEVFSDKDFAARLEYGYVGVDSLGRHVVAPPYPHFRPAHEEVSPQFVSVMERLYGEKNV